MPFLGTSNPVGKPATRSSSQTSEMLQKRTASGLVKRAVQRIEQGGVEAMDGILLETSQRSPTSSLEVSPTESGTVTPRPRLTIAPCPARLTPFHPPKNFGAVESGTIYRSGYPEAHNVEFLELLQLRTVLTLVETEAEPEVQIYHSLRDINHVLIPIIANKEGEIRSTNDSLCQAVLIALNPQNYPLHIHCNRGKHRTGCIVACIRKVQKWPMEEILAEYDTYASPKARPEDMELIRNFNPASVFEYAKEHDLVDSFPRESRSDSATDIWELAAALPPHFMTPSTISEASQDDDLMMSGAMIDPTSVTYTLEETTNDKTPHAPHQSSGPEVSIAEIVEDVEMD